MADFVLYICLPVLSLYCICFQCISIKGNCPTANQPIHFNLMSVILKNRICSKACNFMSSLFWHWLFLIERLTSLTNISIFSSCWLYLNKWKWHSFDTCSCSIFFSNHTTNIHNQVQIQIRLYLFTPCHIKWSERLFSLKSGAH